MSARFRIESGSCYGRDFSTSNPVNVGLCSKFVDFLLRPNVHGSTYTVGVDLVIDHTIDSFDVTGHGFLDGDCVVMMQGTAPVGFTLSTSIAYPLNMSAITPYYVIKISNDRFQLATTRYNALAGTEITFADNGSGAIEITKLGGGAEWNLVEDFSEIITKNFNPADVNVAGNIITIVAHGLPDHCQVVFSTSGSLPGNIVAGTTYWIKRIDADTFYVFNYAGYAIYGTSCIDITSQGTGVHKVTMQERFMVFCDTVGALVNDYDTSPSGMPPKYIRIGFLENEAGCARMHSCLYWDSINHIPRGMWTGYKLPTYDAATFAYDFRGGDECIFWSSRLGSSWSRTFIDQWTGISSLVEPMTVKGIVQAPLTAGSSVVIQLDTGEAVNFTQDKYYYIYDLDGHTWIGYFKVTNVNVGADQITASNIYNNFPAGSVITPYAHRFYGNNTNGDQAWQADSYMLNSANNTLPYYSYITSASNNSQQIRTNNNNPIGTSNQVMSPKYNDSILAVANPDDELNFYGMRYLVAEFAIDYNNTTSMNRIYGKTNNYIRTKRDTMSQMLDYRVMDGKNWLDLDEDGNTYVSCFLHSESSV